MHAKTVVPFDGGPHEPLESSLLIPCCCETCLSRVIDPGSLWRRPKRRRRGATSDVMPAGRPLKSGLVSNAYARMLEQGQLGCVTSRRGADGGEKTNVTITLIFCSTSVPHAFRYEPG